MADKAVSPESNDMGSNLKCVPLSELFTLSELQEMEDKNPRSTWRKKNAHCKHHGVIEDAKYDGAHKARDAVSTWSVRNVYGLPSFLPVREAGGSSGEADSVSEASPWPGPHSWEERRAPRERAEGTHLPEKRVGGGGRGQKRAHLPTPTPSQPKPPSGPSRRPEPQTQSRRWCQPHSSTAIRPGGAGGGDLLLGGAVEAPKPLAHWSSTHWGVGPSKGMSVLKTCIPLQV